MYKNDPSIFSASLSPEGNQPKYFISPISKCGEKKCLDSVIKKFDALTLKFFFERKECMVLLLHCLNEAYFSSARMLSKSLINKTNI